MMPPLRLVKSAYSNNPFVGLFSRASDSMVLCPSQAPPKFHQTLTEALGVPIHLLLINQSNLLGISSVLNSSGVVLQASAEAEETRLLRSLGLNTCALEKLSPGMNIIANDKGAWASPRVPPAALKKIGDCLGVEVVREPFSISSLASSTVVTNKGFYSSSELTETEVKQLERIFKVKGGLGTTNTGVPFNALGMVANSQGAVVGRDTSGFETQRAYEALGSD